MTDKVNTASTGSEELLEHIRNGITYFLSTMSPELREKLDFSPNSLIPFENWLLQHYNHEYNFSFDEDEQLVNGLVFYVGETYRKYLGGHWDLLSEDSEERYGIHFSSRVVLFGVIGDEYINVYGEIREAVHHRFGFISGLKQTLESLLEFKD